VTGLEEGPTYYFAATAYDTSGTESGYSSQVMYSVPGENGATQQPGRHQQGLRRATLRVPVCANSSAGPAIHGGG